MTQPETPVTEQSADASVARRSIRRLIEMGTDPRFRLIALLVVGIAAWILVIFSFPLEVAIPRYADF